MVRARLNWDATMYRYRPESRRISPYGENFAVYLIIYFKPAMKVCFPVNISSGRRLHLQPGLSNSTSMSDYQSAVSRAHEEKAWLTRRSYSARRKWNPIIEFAEAHFGAHFSLCSYIHGCSGKKVQKAYCGSSIGIIFESVSVKRYFRRSVYFAFLALV